MLWNHAVTGDEYLGIKLKTVITMKTRYTQALSILLVSSASWGTATAGPYNGIHPLQSDRFSIGFGGFFSDIDGSAYKDSSRVDKSVDVDIHDDMGLDDSKTLPAAVFTWRIANKYRFQAEYFTIGQDGDKTLMRDIDWDHLNFETGVEIQSEMDLDIFRAFYGYSFVKDAKMEFGAGLGLHYLDFEISLKGDAYINVNGEPVLTYDAERKIDDWAILPNLGVYGNYAFSPKWIAMGRIDWISASFGDYSGGLWNVEAAVQYQAFKHFGLGLAYRYVAFNLDADKGEGDWGGDLDYTGPLLFVTTNF